MSAVQAWELEFRSSTSIKQNNSYLIIIIDIVIHAFNPSAKEQRKVAPGASLENQCRQNGEPQIQGISKVKYNREKYSNSISGIQARRPKKNICIHVHLSHTHTPHTFKQHTQASLGCPSGNYNTIPHS